MRNDVIARFEVLKARRKFARDRHVFRDDLMELLAEASAVVRLEKKVPTDNRAAGQALDRRNGWLRKVATEAIVVWDHEEPRMGKVVNALEQAMPDDVWIVSP